MCGMATLTWVHFQEQQQQMVIGMFMVLYRIVRVGANAKTDSAIKDVAVARATFCASVSAPAMETVLDDIF
jgi:hypothetical protein